DCAVAVDWPRDLGADVRISQSASAGSEQVSLEKHIDPPAPVLAAHYGDGVADLLVGGRFDRSRRDVARGEVDRFSRVDAADRLERGIEGFAGARIHPLWGCQAVDNQIDLAHLLADTLGGRLLELVGIGVSAEG